ncbi:mesoderm-specific transcript-like protein [Elysia marginata]|uniref:Mesoderm-specific transcript-like protein n=1 Tax=Elysia marginata TaxID=1093978 RepID=A0AAV4GWY4_9GAST|nr:mesoderm-specific transcript-like protein [Elysia marginata]
MVWNKYVIGGSIIAALAIYLKYPAPNLSKRLKSWQNKGRYLNFKDWNIFYIEEKGTGDAGPVVCLHGFPTSSFDWIKIFPKLQEQFSLVIMLDFLGYGFSDKPQSHVYTIGEQADIVERLLASLGVTEAHILSHDYGDTVALELLARFNAQKLSIKMQSLIMLNGGMYCKSKHRN